MRFRSLVLDYKAEAIQIMREESNRETKRRRVIRIVPDSSNESIGKSEIQTTSTTQNENSDPQELPSWLSGSPLNQNNSSIDSIGDVTNAVVTPIVKRAAVDGNKVGEGGMKSFEKPRINDCNVSSAISKHSMRTKLSCYTVLHLNYIVGFSFFSLAEQY